MAKLALLVFWVVVLPASWAVAGGTPKLVNADKRGVAIKGYDPVAYFTEGRPVKGKSDYAYIWNDATWYFSSEENSDLFAANPERFAPQYGGY
jgi:YHS domain-containing protein